MKKPLNILVVSYDWRNIFENNFSELMSKLKRDRLLPDLNNLFLLAWSSKNYFRKKENVATVHIKTFLGRARFFYDLLSIFLTPVILFWTKFKPDIMVVRDFPMVTAGFFTKVFFGTKIIFFLGSMPTDLARTRKFSFFRRLYQKLCEILSRLFVDTFIANGLATKDYLVRMGVRAEEIKIMVEDVIHRDKELIKAAKKGEIRQLYNINSSKKILLSVGRLETEKNFEGLLRSVKGLTRDDFILIIVGEGSLKESLVSLTRNLKLEDRVIFSGFVTREKIWNYYLEADAFILLSSSEGNPTVFREAMFVGVPVIGSRILPIEEFTGRNEERGFLWSGSDGLLRLTEIMGACFNKSAEVKEKLKKAKAYIEENIAKEVTINDIFLDL